MSRNFANLPSKNILRQSLAITHILFRLKDLITLHFMLIFKSDLSQKDIYLAPIEAVDSGKIKDIKFLVRYYYAASHIHSCALQLLECE